MRWFKERIWIIGCIVMIIALSILTANFVVINKQNKVLVKETISNMNAEWYQLYLLSEMIDKNYIKNNFQDSKNFQLYVNQTCYHFSFTGRPNKLNENMRNLLVWAYDPLFFDLSIEKGPLDMEEAVELLKQMNGDIMLISKSIIDMKDNEKEKLLEPMSSDYIKVNRQVKNAAKKYTKLVEVYFRKYQGLTEKQN